MCTAGQRVSATDKAEQAADQEEYDRDDGVGP